jgi:FtsZ-interacting cell division protein ZipA
MSTGLTVAIVVVAIIVVAALLFAVGRSRRAAAERRHQRKLERRREQAATEHRDAADAGLGRADEAEHRARVATALAERERADANLHQETARAHELGLADDELPGDAPATERAADHRREEGAAEREEVLADSRRQNTDR